jgi:hypothetical protein
MGITLENLFAIFTLITPLIREPGRVVSTRGVLVATLTTGSFNDLDLCVNCTAAHNLML